MILDLQTMFSGTVAADGTKTAQAITATAISTNVLDLKQSALPALTDEGIFGLDVWLIVTVIQAFNTLTSLTISLESSAAEALSAATVHLTSGAILLAQLTANRVVVQNQLPSQQTYLRYLGMRYTVAGTNPTQGSILAFLTQEPSRPAIYPSGFTVDS